MKLTKYLIASIAVLTVCSVRADEGMWLLQLMKQQNSTDMMKKQGLKLEADDLYNPNGVSLKDAVGIFGGGCTGEIISPEGLILTNHHSGYGAIQQHSSVEHDYLTDGFWAKNRSEELPTPGLKFRFVHRIVDITGLVNEKVKAGEVTEVNALTAPFLNKLAKEELEKSDLNGKPGIEVKALPFYAGNKFYLFYYKVYSDVQENDYTMIMGFPGRTSRYLTQSEVKERMEADNQAMIDMRGVRLDVLRKYMDASDKTRIQYANKFAGSSNYWKNSIGMNKAIIDNDVLGTKAEQEKKFAEFAKGKPEYEGVVDKMDGIIAKRMPVTRQLNYLYEALSGAIEFGSPYMIMDKIKTALEEKNDSLLTASTAQLEEVFNDIHNKDYDHEVDRAVAKAILPALAQKLKPEELPAFYLTVQNKYKGDYNAFIDDIYDNSILSNRANFDKFMKKPTIKAIEKDPATAYSRSKVEKLRAVAMEEKALSEGLDLLHKAYIRGLGEMKLPVPSYPDANFTIRLTYGNVKSYSPRDAVHYNYYTTTDGILEKENPEDREFVVPAKLKELILNKDFGRYAMADGTMPVCFLTTNDITGGNSGSPVINGEGQLIGCAFDGNWESLSGDINFDNNLQRCIALDIRYVLFILEKLGDCGHLIKEMNIVE